MNLRLLYLATTSVLGFTLLANGQNQTYGSPAHFRWSEHIAHELDYKHTIATAKELSPQERTDLLTFVLNRFRYPVNAHDEEMFEGISDREMRKLAGDTRIEFVDLDGDGTKEIIAQGNGLGPCGGTGNCIVLVLKSTPAGWKTLLDSQAGEFGGGFEKIRVMDTVTNGFRDVVLGSHVSASDRTLEVFRYSGGRYTRSDCYYATMTPNGVIDEGRKFYDISRGCPGEK